MIDFCRDWTFRKENGAPAQVHLPHDAMLLEKRDPLCPNGKETGYFPGGKYVYEKIFTIESENIGKYIALLFEGVYQNAVVLVNGKQLAMHGYGYTEFTVDISEVVAAGENTVMVRVDNSLEPNCRWYTGSGIYRPVSLVIRHRDYIRDVKITTLSIHPAVVRVEANTSADAQDAAVEIWDGNALVATGGLGDIAIPNAKLWSAEHPQLYTCIIKTPADEERLSFGVRTLKWSAKTGLLVNGGEVLLRGACIHHDNGILGACGFADAEERRVRILKAAGYNAIRAAHNPCSRAMLAACDRLGMYMMDEAFDGWYTPKNYHDNAWRFTNAIESWSWPGCEGEKAMVDVFSTAAMVELRLNGKPLGRVRPKEYRAVFKIEYQPGTLTAAALDETGAALAETSLTTAGNKTQLSAVPEKTRLRANGQDLCYLPIELTDENGNQKPAKDVRVCVEVKGAATLQGLGSGLERTEELFGKPCHHTHLGRALAVLRAGYTPGKAVVSVSAEGMAQEKIEIMVE